MAEEKKLTVLQLLPALQSGGVERGTLEVAQALTKQGHRALVISAGGRLVAPLTKTGAEHFTWPIGKKSLKTLLLVGKLRKFLAEEKVDIVHARSRVPAWIAWLAWRGMNPSTRPRFVTTVHGPYSVSAYSAVMTKGERVIAISKMIINYIVRNYPKVPQENVRLIYRGVDPKQFPSGYTPPDDWMRQWQQEHPGLAGKKILLLPARLTRWKGQTDFIDMLEQVIKTRPDVHGLIVGETHPRKQAFMAELEARSKRLGVCQHLSFISHRADLREIMAISDIVYSLSREPEAFGRVSLEALSLGKPLIAYDHGGVKEQLAAILPEGAISVGDIGQAARKTLRWLDAPPHVPEQNPFTLERMLTATLDVYTELARAPRSK
ncbi:MAG: glycosyltransferase family 4 protein [Proteobacteria bacterium]|nr:glycosyltransferase family 4 protein [Pseudomonadota bacterium]